MSESLLNDEEIEVYDLVKEFNQKKSFYGLEEIIDFINNRLRSNPDFNRNKVELILKSLLNKNIIVPGTKLVKENILQVPLRKNIFVYIENNPGTNINEVMKALKIGTGQVLWHLKFLNKFQFIREVLIENKKALFKFSIDADYDNISFYLRNEKVKKIVKLMETNKTALRPTKISEELNLHYNTTKKYLEILVNLKLLKKVNGNDKKKFELNQEIFYKTLETIKTLR